MWVTNPPTLSSQWTCFALSPPLFYVLRKRREIDNSSFLMSFSPGTSPLSSFYLPFFQSLSTISLFLSSSFLAMNHILLELFYGSLFLLGRIRTVCEVASSGRRYVDSIS